MCGRQYDEKAVLVNKGDLSVEVLLGEVRGTIVAKKRVMTVERRVLGKRM